MKVNSRYAKIGVVFAIIVIAILFLSTYKSNVLTKFVNSSEILSNLGISLPNQTSIRYTIDREKSLQVLKELGYPQTNLQITNLKSPPEKIGVVSSNVQGKIIIGSAIDASDRDTIKWSLFVDQEYIDLMAPEYSPKENNEQKSIAISNIALASFIIYSQQPNRSLDTIYPSDNKPILVTFP